MTSIEPNGQAWWQSDAKQGTQGSKGADVQSVNVFIVFITMTSLWCFFAFLCIDVQCPDEFESVKLGTRLELPSLTTTS